MNNSSNQIKPEISDWNQVFQSFPVNRKLIWLNNCGTTPAGTHIIESMQNYLETYSKYGLMQEESTYGKLLQSIRSILAGLLKCSSEDLTLVHNTAEGMNLISHGYDFSSGDEVLLLENEYPSNVYPWKHLSKKGVVIRTVPMGRTPGEFNENLAQSCNSKTKLAALSTVHWCTGMPYDLGTLSSICKQNNVRLVLDGAQGVGMVDIDLSRVKVDAMVFPAWKWLLGPLGLGVMYISKSFLPELKPVFLGTGSVVREMEYLPYKDELKSGSDRYIYSTPSLSDWVYFESSLKFLQNLGFHKVRNRIYFLAAQLAGGLREMGFKPDLDEFSGISTGIVSALPPNHISASKLLNQLKHKNIVCAERLNRLRFAPHIYLSSQLIEKALNEVKHLISR